MSNEQFGEQFGEQRRTAFEEAARRDWCRNARNRDLPRQRAAGLSWCRSGPLQLGPVSSKREHWCHSPRRITEAAGMSK